MEDDIVIVGVDYMVINGIFIFVFGEIIKIVEVVVNGDCFYESNEKFLFKFSNVSNVNLEDFQGIGIIIDDDVVFFGFIINNVSVIEGNEGVIFV